MRQSIVLGKINKRPMAIRSIRLFGTNLKEVVPIVSTIQWMKDANNVTKMNMMDLNRTVDSHTDA